MLPLSVIQEVQQLLEAGDLSQRQIALRVGVSRGTVGALASGKRGIFGKEPQSELQSSSAPACPPERCRGCGGLVLKPCRLCRVRSHQHRCWVNRYFQQQPCRRVA